MTDLAFVSSTVAVLPPAPLRIAVLGSGFGSNFRCLFEEIKSRTINAQIVCVAGDDPESGILKFAKSQNIPVVYVESGKFKATLEPLAEGRLARSLREHRVELVVLAGFMRILKHELLSAYAGRIINIHPSLLPKYRGMHAWKQALDSGDTITGCTVHYVDAGVDTGAIIAQAEVDIQPGDTAESLHARIQKAEHLLLPMVVSEICQHRSEYLVTPKN